MSAPVLADTEEFLVARVPAPNPLQLAVDAFANTPGLHSTLLVYTYLYSRGEAACAACGGLPITLERLGRAVGLAVPTVRRALVLLRRIGLVVAAGRGDRLRFLVPAAPSRWTVRVLEGVRSGAVFIDAPHGVLAHVDSGKDLDYEALPTRAEMFAPAGNFPTHGKIADAEMFAPAGNFPTHGKVDRPGGTAGPSRGADLTDCGATTSAEIPGPESGDAAAPGEFNLYSLSSSAVGREDRSTKRECEINAPPDLPGARPADTPTPVPRPPSRRRGPGRPAFDRTADALRPQIEACWEDFKVKFDRPLRTLTPDRYRAIRNAVTTLGYTFEQLAIVWELAAADPHVRGQNDRGNPWDNPDQILRPKHIDKYLEMHARGERPRGAVKDPQYDLRLAASADPTGASDIVW